MGLDALDQSMILEYALMHDIDEIWTGDMPSPHKETLAKREPLPESLEGGRYIHSDTPEDARLVRTGSLPSHLKAIIRGADLIDAWQWISQYGNGRHRHQVMVDCWDRLNKFMWANGQGSSLVCAMKKVIENILEE